ncbi:MAG TPA: hypothetical protein VE396_10980, partial [Xanthobacteraceae bacterium]|nr:hypothetical protein [Xanthobacteraceae bacterium]
MTDVSAPILFLNHTPHGGRWFTADEGFYGKFTKNEYHIYHRYFCVLSGTETNMLSRISVSTLLKSVIAVLGAAIVVMLALSARDSWARLNAADRISGVANVSGYMFTAMNSLRVDRSATGRNLLNDRTTIDPILNTSRDKEMPALNSLPAALAAVDFSDRDQAIAYFNTRIKRLTDLQERTAAIAQPKSARPAGLGDEFFKEGTAMMDALDMWGSRLV